MAATLKSTEVPSDLIEKMSNFPEFILLFSGKRKSGKDYITNKLFETLDPKLSVIIKISGPIKNHWAKASNLDLNKLLSDGIYKEKYRFEMTKWGEEMRNKDYGYFCRSSIDMYNGKDKKIWIVSDIRRKTDLKWFEENYPGKCKKIRIICNNEIRSKRGWIFTPGIDDCDTECNLDDVENWDLIINNENEKIENILEKIINLMK